jgi:hypothetical protein
VSNKTNLRNVVACMVILCNLSWSHAADNMVATLLLPRTVPQGEPLPVTIQVKNTSEEKRVILIPYILRFGPDTVVFSIKNPASSDYKKVQRPDIYVGGLKMRSPGMLTVRHMSPGEVVEYSFSLVYDFPVVDERKWLFVTPGRYSVQATVFELVDAASDVNEVRYDARRRPVLTDSSDVEIVPPKSQREKDALHALWKLPDEYLIYEPFAFRSDCHAEVTTHLREYFRNYADTDIGRRAALPLGIAVAEGIISDDSGAIRKTLESMSQGKQSQLRATASAVLEKMAKRNQ